MNNLLDYVAIQGVINKVSIISAAYQPTIPSIHWDSNGALKQLKSPVRFGCLEDKFVYIPKDVQAKASQLEMYAARPRINYDPEVYEKMGKELDFPLTRGQKFCLKLIRSYQSKRHAAYSPDLDKVVESVTGKNGTDVCPFYDSCSNFANDAIAIDGVFWGIYQTALRLVGRCNGIWPFFARNRKYCVSNGEVKVFDPYYDPHRLDEPDKQPKHMLHKDGRSLERAKKLDEIMNILHQRDIKQWQKQHPDQAQAPSAQIINATSAQDLGQADQAQTTSVQ